MLEKDDQLMHRAGLLYISTVMNKNNDQWNSLNLAVHMLSQSVTSSCTLDLGNVLIINIQNY